MSRHTRLAWGLVAVTAAVAVGAELAARAAIDSRLPDTHQARFTGDSALLALATDQLSITFTLTEGDVEATLSRQMDLSQEPDVTLVEGAIAVSVPIQSQSATAWLELKAAGGLLTATVMSIDVGGVQFGPGIVESQVDPLVFDGMLPTTCGVPIDDAAVHSSGVDVAITLTRETAACLTSGETS